MLKYYFPLYTGKALTMHIEFIFEISFFLILHLKIYVERDANAFLSPSYSSPSSPLVHENRRHFAKKWKKRNPPVACAGIS